MTNLMDNMRTVEKSMRSIEKVFSEICCRLSKYPPQRDDKEIRIIRAARAGNVEVLSQLLSERDQLAPITRLNGLTALHCAVRSENPNAVQCLLQAGIYVDVRGGDAMTPLHFASSMGRMGIVAVLVEAGANINAVDVDGYTPLMYACLFRHADLALWFMDKGAVLTKRNQNCVSALTIACAKGSEKIVERILQERQKKLPYAQGFAKEKSVVHVTVGKGHIPILRMLLDAGADVNQFAPVAFIKELVQFDLKTAVGDHDLLTPLMVACIVGSAYTASCLIKRGADVLKANISGTTAFLLAAAFGHVDLVKCLLSRGVEVNAKDNSGQTALHKAMMAGHAPVVDLLLEEHADMEVKDKYYNSPFELAAKNGHVKVIWAVKNNKNEFLLGKKVIKIIDSAARSGHAEFIKTLFKAGVFHRSPNAVSISVVSKHINCLKVLVAAGYNVNASGELQDEPPLLLAARYGEVESLKILLNAGAEVGKKSGDGKMSLHVAAEKGHVECVKALLKVGAPVDARRAARWTPLHYAVENGHGECIKVLLAHGANINATYLFGNTVLHGAAQNEHYEVVKLLVEAGAPYKKNDRGQWPAEIGSRTMCAFLEKLICAHERKS